MGKKKKKGVKSQAYLSDSHPVLILNQLGVKLITLFGLQMDYLKVFAGFEG